MPRRSSRYALALAAVVLGGCSLQADTTHLTALGIRVQEFGLGTYRFTGDGYTFELPGVPRAERQRYGFAGHRVEAVFFDLSTGMNWREYLFRAFDTRALSPSDRERVREEAEAQLTRAGGEVSHRRTLQRGEAIAHQVVVQRLNGRDDLSAIVRTSVRGGQVFQQAVFVVVGDGEWSDVHRFLDALEVDEDPATEVGPLEGPPEGEYPDD